MYVQDLDIHFENNFLDDLNHVINIDNEDEIHSTKINKNSGVEKKNEI